MVIMIMIMVIIIMIMIMKNSKAFPLTESLMWSDIQAEDVFLD